MGAGEAPGVWRGSWAGGLGLEGVVSAEDLHALVNGFDPDSGMDLLAGRRERTVRAIDVTLSCPKSVSVLWAFGTPRDLGGRVDRGGRSHRCGTRVLGGTRRVRPSPAGWGATPGRHGRVRDRDVRSSHQSGGGPAAAHPLSDPQCGGRGLNSTGVTGRKLVWCWCALVAPLEESRPRRAVRRSWAGLVASGGSGCRIVTVGPGGFCSIPSTSAAHRVRRACVPGRVRVGRQAPRQSCR